MGNNIFYRSISSNLRPHKGFVLGLLIALAPLKLEVFIPIIFMYIALSYKKIKLPKTYKVILWLIIYKIIFIILISLLYKEQDLYLGIMKALTFEVILILFLFIPFSNLILRNIFYSIVFLFWIDFSFNLSILFFDMDLLGRAVDTSSFFKRLTGVFHHPYDSINLSITALFIGVYTRSKTLIFFSIIILLVNASLRGPLSVILILFLAFLINFKFNRIIINFALFGSIALVFIVTIVDASFDVSQTSNNFFRVLKWNIGLSHISDSFLFGKHFYDDPNMVVFNGIEYSTRNYESNFLGHAVDYGMPIALITPIILFILMQINIKRFYSYDCHWSSFAAALMSAFAFVDYFYGTFYGSIIAMSAYSLIVISNKGLRNNKIKKVK